MSKNVSSRPLVKKLDIREASVVELHGAPVGFSDYLEPMPEDVLILSESRRRNLDLIVWFVTRQSLLMKRIGVMARRIGTQGSLWIAWPKRSSGVASDVDGNTVREAILESGLVDNKVCAIDETWSGLRGVVRLRDR